MVFDGIITKKIVDELSKLNGYKIDKIYQPDKNTVILGMYGNFTNIALLSCISSNNYRIHLTTHNVKNPEIAPNFCMLLRKHILGYKIKKIYAKNLERIVFIELENNENPDKILYKTLVVELMGKHSNIILINENGIIIDAIRHTSTEEKSQRDIYPTARYFEPIIKKINLLETKNFEEFYKKLNIQENISEAEENIISEIANTYNGIGLSNLEKLKNEIINEEKNEYVTTKLFVHKIYNKILKFLDEKNENFKLNFELDDFYYEKENNELFKNYRNTILNIILSTLKKYEKRLNNIDEKLEDCKNKDKYKLYGELITANLYKIPNYNVDLIELENYYDENKVIEIPLDKKYSPQNNAKRYYKKYNKLKNALEVVSKQKQETLQEIEYIQSVVYELETCKTIDDVQEIYNEISENEIFKFNISKKNSQKQKKSKKMTTNKFASFNPLKYVIEGYTIYVGRNNKENDYLTNKFAEKNDIWFHTKDVHGSHVILKNNLKGNIPENIIQKAAKLAIIHSKAKNSSNVPVDYCKVCFVKKIPGNKPGLVIYKNNKTIYI